ncbi:MAG TPA: efflux RND transporter permease subunit [Armatimonadota bacterium]|nr:efflux RND transporter permease subunit [Armatimonadota bacterium]
MSIWGLAVRRPIFIAMVMLALVVVGFIGYSRLGMDLLPQLNIPYVTVIVVYPGAGPREIETEVTKRIEDAVATTRNVKHISSSSFEGVSAVVIEFEVGIDADLAAQDIRDKVAPIEAELPADAERPVISKVDLEARSVLELAVASDLALTRLRRLAQDTIAPRLERVNGVAAANVYGGLQREIQVAVDRGRLQAYGFSFDQLAQTLAAGNLDLPAGHINDIGRRITVRVPATYDSIEDIRRTLIMTPQGPVRLRDIAEVRDTHQEADTITRLNRRPTVNISVIKVAEANIVQTAAGVRQAVDELNRQLPAGTKIEVVLDRSEFARESVADVTNNLILGGLLAVIVVFLFLRSFRSTVIASFALPTSVISAFGLMYFAGFTLNMLSMLALALAIGMLIDDAIVVVENVFRHLEEGESPREAAINGTGEIALAVTAITLTIVVVFAPIAFMRGIAGQFFREFGLTVAFAVLVSLLVSLTLTPMLASRLLVRPRAKRPGGGGVLDRIGAFYDRVDVAYRGALDWSLRHRRLVVLIGVGSFIGGLLLIRFAVPQEPFPRLDTDDLQVQLKLPGGASLASTDQVARGVEDLLLRVPEVERVLARVGGGGAASIFGGGGGANEATIDVKLKSKRARTSWAIMDEVRRELRSWPDLIASVNPAETFGPSAAPIQIDLTGAEVEELLRIAGRWRDRIRDIPGVTDLDLSVQPGSPESIVRVDRVKAANRGLTPAQIALALRAAVDGVVATRYREGGDEYDVRVQLRDRDRQRVGQLEDLALVGVSGQLVPLRDVAHLGPATGPTVITRTDKERTVSLRANLLGGYVSGPVSDQITQRLAPYAKQLPRGYKVTYRGDVESRREIFGPIYFALGLSVLFVYMVLAAQFESFVHPFTIGLSLPLSIVGAAVLLWLTGGTVNIMSLIGIVMLMGLVTKNAILLVDYTNTLRRRGLERDAALLQAGPTRLRPILMTTAAMVFGMAPVALGLGQGAEMRAPMAIAVIGGLLSSMFLTLLMVPVVYGILDELPARFRRHRRATPDFTADEG